MMIAWEWWRNVAMTEQAVNNVGWLDGCSEKRLLGQRLQNVEEMNMGNNEGPSDGRYEEWSLNNDEWNSETIADNNEGWLNGRFEVYLLSNYECMSSGQSLGHNDDWSDGRFEEWLLSNDERLLSGWSLSNNEWWFDALKNDCLGTMKECCDDGNN